MSLTRCQNLTRCQKLTNGKVRGFSVGSMVKNQPVNAGDAGNMDTVPGLGRSPGGGNDNPLQYFGLENPMGRGP